MKTINLFLFVFCLTVTQVHGQNNVLKNTHKGNIFYMNGAYKDAVSSYEKATTEAPFNFKANYNLGNAFFKLKDYDKAVDKYEAIVDHSKTNGEKATVYHNIGNCYMMKGEFKAAIEAYKNGLRLNPTDESTRYNLSYALLKQKEKEQQEKQENKDKEDKEDQEQQEDQKKEDNKDKGDEDGKDPSEEEDKKDEGQGDEKDNPDEENGDQEKKPKPNKLSKEQAKRLLEAAAKKEKEIQDKKDQKVKIGTDKPKPKKDW